MDVEAEFWTLVKTANEQDAEAFRILNDDDAESVDKNRLLEPIYLTICKLVKDHPSDRQVFVRCFSELVLQKRNSPWMLVPFCMRVLRLPEVEEALKREMDETCGTSRYLSLMNYCSSVMHAYHDAVWEDAVWFDTFSHELESGRTKTTE